MQFGWTDRVYPPTVGVEFERECLVCNWLPQPCLLYSRCWIYTGRSIGSFVHESVAPHRLNLSDRDADNAVNGPLGHRSRADRGISRAITRMVRAGAGTCHFSVYSPAALFLGSGRACRGGNCPGSGGMVAISPWYRVTMCSSGTGWTTVSCNLRMGLRHRPRDAVATGSRHGHRADCGRRHRRPREERRQHRRG